MVVWYRESEPTSASNEKHSTRNRTARRTSRLGDCTTRLMQEETLREEVNTKIGSNTYIRGKERDLAAGNHRVPVEIT